MKTQTTDKGIRETVNELFDQYIIDAFKMAEPIVGIGQQFAYIGIALIALGVFLREDKRADILAYLRWVPLAILLLNYEVITYTIFEFYRSIGNTFKANDISWDTLQNKIFVAQMQALKAEDGTWSLLALDAEGLASIALGFMTSTATSIASFISVVVFIGIKAMSVIYLFVLIIFGPLNIGLSFIPAFSGMWKAWLQKFMSVCLWIPMLYLIDNFMLNILDNLIRTLLSDEDSNLGLVFTSALLMIMNVFVYLKAPTLSNFIVQGMNVSASQLKDRTKHYAKKAAQTAVDAKTGGATKGVRTMIQ